MLPVEKKKCQEALFLFSLHLWRSYTCKKDDTLNYALPIPEGKKTGGQKYLL